MEPGGHRRRPRKRRRAVQALTSILCFRAARAPSPRRNLAQKRPARRTLMGQWCGGLPLTLYAMLGGTPPTGCGAAPLMRPSRFVLRTSEGGHHPASPSGTERPALALARQRASAAHKGGGRKRDPHRELPVPALLLLYILSARSRRRATSAAGRRDDCGPGPPHRVPSSLPRELNLALSIPDLNTRLAGSVTIFCNNSEGTAQQPGN